MKTLTVFFFITIVMVINACNRPPATNYADFMTTKNIQLDEHNISALLGMPGDMISAFANPKYLDDRINIYGAHATSKFRPILDSSLVCSRYKTWFYIVEQMPRPKITTFTVR